MFDEFGDNRQILRKNSNEKVKGPFESGDFDENGENV